MAVSHRGALALYLVTLVAGIAIGVAADRTLRTERRRERAPEPRQMRERFYQDLALTADQRAHMDTILDERTAAYRALMAPLRPQQDSIAAASRQRIVALLTPAQRETYERLQREREARQRAYEQGTQRTPR